MSTVCIELARRLGKALAETSESKALVAAHKKLTENPDTIKDLQAFQEQAMKIAQLEQTGQPIGPDDKHKLQELNGKMVASEAYKQFLSAQVNYADLMRKANLAIRGELPKLE